MMNNYFTTIQIDKTTKVKLDKLKVVDNETNDNVINRLMDRRDWNVVNGVIITLVPSTINTNDTTSPENVTLEKKDVFKEVNNTH